jgi:putative ABC transport system permease protein
MKNKQHSRSLLFRLIRFILERNGHLPFLGDFNEIYLNMVRTQGLLRARLWCAGQIVRSLPVFISYSISWSFFMLRNYIKIALRNIKRQKGYSFINIFGLALGMACSVLIFLWVQDEMGYDRFHEKADRIFRVEFDQKYSTGLFHVGVTCDPLGPAVKEEVPEVTEAARVVRLGSLLFRQGDKMMYVDNNVAVDPSYLDIFSFPLERGDMKTALSDSHSVVLSKPLAEKFFGEKDPLGQVINMNNLWDMKVTGVLKRIPSNSMLQYSCLIPFDVLPAAGRRVDNWQGNSILTYVLLGEQSSPESVTAKIQSTVENHNPDGARDQAYILQPLTRLHLYGHYGFDRSMGPIKYVYIFSFIAFIVLLVACINFMNLATARSGKRSREVGMRKVVGAVKSQIIRQFYTESIVYTLIALLLAVLLVFLLLPFFNNLAGKQLSLQSVNFTVVLAGLFGIAVFTGILAGSYPSLFLSAFQPSLVLKGTFKGSSGSGLFRRILVVAQFTLSVALIIGTGVVLKQLDYMKTTDPGYDKDNILYVTLRGNTRESFDALKAEILKSPAVRAVTASGELPSAVYSNTDGVTWEGKDPESSISFSMLNVDNDFVRTMGLELLEGRDFSKEYPADAETGIIINAKGRRVMGKTSVLGERMTYGEDEYTIVGVVKDFHFQSLREEVEPLFMFMNRDNIYNLLVRINTGESSAAVSHIEKTWKRFVPAFPFEFGFLDKEFEALYVTEERLGQILRVFAGLAVFIACMGLFGLASYMAEQRTKEVGIRKVLGASVSQISLLLCREFVLLVLLANAIAWPVMFLVMKGWLNGFAYRSGLNISVFGSALGTALAVALVSVGFQAVRAARANPAVSLKHE